MFHAHPVRPRSLFIGLVIVLLFAVIGSAAAQGAVLAYGQAVAGRIDAAAPLAFFSFTGSAGDLVTARAIAVSDGLDPSLSILSTTQQQLGSNDNDPLLPGSSDARVSVRLPAAGTYTILVGSAAGTSGDLLVTLDGRPGVPALPLAAGASAVADFVANPAPVDFDLQVGAAAAMLTLRAQTASPFAAEVRSPEGRVIASVSEGVDVSILLPPATAPYALRVFSALIDAPANVAVSLGAGSAVQLPSLPPTASAPSTGLAGCVVTPGGQINVRSGPSTNYPIIGQLAAGDARQATGANAARDWYVISYNGAVGYVAASVVTVTPDCAGVPVVADPPLPSGPAQPTAVPAQPTTALGQPTVAPTLAPPTATTAPGQPTATTAPPTATTVPPTVAPTLAPPTATPTVAQQVAPPDNDYNVALDRNNGGQFSQVISNPGDTTDSLFVSVNNFDSINNFAQFAVTLVCVGDGTQNVSWGLNQGGSNVCGGSATITLTNDSNNQRITLTLNGTGYVNYTFIFTRVS